MDAESPKFLVSTSVLDAADFTAAFLLTSCGKDALILVDATDERTSDPALDSYDHRFAVPIPGRFSKSPDGLVRQEVVAIDALLSTLEPRRLLQERTADYFLSEPIACRFSGLLSAAKVLFEGGKSPCEAFIQACAASLGVIIRVGTRKSRALSALQMADLAIIVKAELAQRNVTSIAFRQGGAVLVDGVSARGVTLLGGALLLNFEGGSVLDWEEASHHSRECLLRGPLDALVAKLDGYVLGHLPWFLGARPIESSSSHQPCVSIVRSVFSKNKQVACVVPNEPNFFLLDEFSPPYLREHLKASGLDGYDWIFDSVRELASLPVASDERWAWSQSSARRFSSAVVKCDTTRFSEHPFSRILRRHEILSNYARDLHSGNGGLPDKIAEIGICYYEELEFWRIFCLKTGLGSAFNGASIYSCDMLESKFRAIPKSVSAKYLSDLRFFYKELILIAISSIMIIGDTTCRASLCSLALTHSDDSFGQVIGMYREIILDRASKYLGIECI